MDRSDGLDVVDLCFALPVLVECPYPAYVYSSARSSFLVRFPICCRSRRAGPCETRRERIQGLVEPVLKNESGYVTQFMLPLQSLVIDHNFENYNQ